MPHCFEQNGWAERGIRTNKEHCVHRQRFKLLQHVSRVFNFNPLDGSIKGGKVGSNSHQKTQNDV
jgi:hypothetical protein